MINQDTFDCARKFCFIVGTSLLIFSAFRNSLIWHLEKFWGASGDFWQNLYESAYKIFGNEEKAVYVYGTFIITTAVFWIINSFFIILDVLQRPKFLLPYKIQPGVNTPVAGKDLAKAVALVLFNQIVVGPLVLLPSASLMIWRGCTFQGPLPTFQWVLIEMVVFSLVEELGFYYSHRLLHHRFFYRHIHKLHHDWRAPISITSIYAHPIEHVFSNLLPPFLGPLLMGSHLGTAWLWYCLAFVSTTNAHCGYHLPFMPSPEAHDFHHLKFNNNFGVLGVLDRLHGTDELFRASKCYERHLMMLSLTPPRLQYPDVKEPQPSTSSSANNVSAD